MIIFSRENFLSICRIEMNKWFFQRTFQGPLRNSVSELLQRRWRRRGGDAANLNGIFNRQSLASFDKFSNQIQKQKIIKTLKNHRKNRICKQHYNIFQLVVLNIYIYMFFFLRFCISWFLIFLVTSATLGHLWQHFVAPDGAVFYWLAQWVKDGPKKGGARVRWLVSLLTLKHWENLGSFIFEMIICKAFKRFKMILPYKFVIKNKG